MTHLPSPAAVQAVSAVAVVILTAALVGVTAKYVKLTSRLATEAENATKLSERNFERTVLMNAPALLVAEGPYFEPDPRDAAKMAFRVAVVNVGAGVATEIGVEVDGWPEPLTFLAQVPVQSGPMQSAIQLVCLGLQPRGEDHVLAISRFLFTDLGGTRYGQPVGGRPTIEDV